MPNKGTTKIEFRYYKMPDDVPFLALFDENWKQQYGKGIDYLHFHNYLEIGYCYDGTGTLAIGKEKYRYEKNCFSIIPQNCIHTTDSDPNTISSWEYLFIDIDSLLLQMLPIPASHPSGSVSPYRSAYSTSWPDRIQIPPDMWSHSRPLSVSLRWDTGCRWQWTSRRISFPSVHIRTYLLSQAGTVRTTPGRLF